MVVVELEVGGLVLVVGTRVVVGRTAVVVLDVEELELLLDDDVLDELLDDDDVLVELDVLVVNGASVVVVEPATCTRTEVISSWPT